MVQATVDGIWEVFRAFLEDESIKKAWHNYSFDRHVLGNMWVGGRPIQAAGFHADTMHMARLWDASRKGKGYSLEALSGCAFLTSSYSHSSKSFSNLTWGACTWLVSVMLL